MTNEQFNNRIIFKLVNKDKNAELLKKIPFKEYLDLAVIFYVMVSDDGTTMNCRLVTNELIEIWGVDDDFLMECALDNTPRLLGLKIRGIMTTVASYLDDDVFKAIAEEEDRSMPMYVATNNKATHGAAVLIYRDMLKAFAARKKSDIYIIPCSAHEIIMIPNAECPGVDTDELKKLIYYVNRNDLREEDFLSDNLYYYNCVEDKVTIV